MKVKRKKMSNRPVSVDDNTAVAMPIRNMLAIIGAVAVGVWSYFGIVERLNNLETKNTLLEKDITQMEQFMLIEHIAGQVEQIQKSMESMMNNGVNIKRLQEDVKILRDDVEKLKDSNREIIYKNGTEQ